MSVVTATIKPPQLRVTEFQGETFETNNTEQLGNVFIPDWNNKPEDVKPLVSLNGIPFLTHQNTSMIIALPGIGKSSMCESIGASFINPEADALGFSVDPDCEGIIIIDNERTNIDVWNSFYRMSRRAQVPRDTKVENVLIAGLRAIPRLDERLKTIEYFLQNHPCSLLLIDGLGDLVTDPNDQPQAIDCRIWLRETTSNYHVSILTTIHPNPGSNKPRGHIGSEGHREAECVLLAKNAQGDVRLITSDFEHGKNRNNAPITAAYRWSDDHKMFISADVDSISLTKPKEGIKKIKNELLIKKVLPSLAAKTHTELIEAIMDENDVSESTAKRSIKEAIEFGFIKNYEDGLYRAIV
jgi:hypothetical protein